MSQLINVSNCKIFTSVGIIDFYLPFEDRSSVASRIENTIKTGGTFRYKDVKCNVIVLSKKLLAKSIITFSSSHNKTFSLC
jgi:hypothetical protein